jgi:hypothetical protein
MKLRKFDKADWDLFAGAVNPEGITEFENEATGHGYVVIVDSYGITIDRYDYDGGSDFVTIEMLPSQALRLVQMMEIDFEALDELVDDAQPGIYKEV